MTGYLVKNWKESLAVQKYLFKKGYKWGNRLRDVMQPEVPVNIPIGKYGTVILFDASNTLVYEVLNTTEELEYIFAHGYINFLYIRRKIKLSI